MSRKHVARPYTQGPSGLATFVLIRGRNAVSAGGIIGIYGIGLVLIWIAMAIAVEKEPTSHGQDVLTTMGCLLGIFWPLAIAYFVIASPWIAWQLWASRGER